jgi:hypothetical protein
MRKLSIIIRGIEFLITIHFIKNIIESTCSNKLLMANQPQEVLGDQRIELGVHRG